MPPMMHDLLAILRELERHNVPQAVSLRIVEAVGYDWEAFAAVADAPACALARDLPVGTLIVMVRQARTLFDYNGRRKPSDF